MAISKGDRFTLTRNWRGHGASHFAGQPDREVQCVLEKGTVLVATEDVNVMATGFHCVVEDAEARAPDLVPEEQRTDPAYTGFSFVFFVGDVGALLSDVTASA